MTLRKKTFENNVGKEEDAGIQRFLFSHTLFYPLRLNSLPNDKFLDWSKLKAFANNNLKMKILFGWVENIVGKGENAGYQHFLLFSQCFLKASFSGSLKVSIVW